MQGCGFRAKSNQLQLDGASWGFCIGRTSLKLQASKKDCPDCSHEFHTSRTGQLVGNSFEKGGGC